MAHKMTQVRPVRPTRAYAASDDCQSCDLPAEQCGHVRPEDDWGTCTACGHRNEQHDGSGQCNETVLRGPHLSECHCTGGWA